MLLELKRKNVPTAQAALDFPRQIPTEQELTIANPTSQEMLGGGLEWIGGLGSTLCEQMSAGETNSRVKWPRTLGNRM